MKRNKKNQKEVSAYTYIWKKKVTSLLLLRTKQGHRSIFHKSLGKKIYDSPISNVDALGQRTLERFDWES